MNFQCLVKFVIYMQLLITTGIYIGKSFDFTNISSIHQKILKSKSTLILDNFQLHQSILHVLSVIKWVA